MNENITQRNNIKWSNSKENDMDKEKKTKCFQCNQQSVSYNKELFCYQCENCGYIHKTKSQKK